MTEAVRTLKPEEIIRTLAAGGPGKEWIFQRVQEDGSKVQMRYRMQVLLAQENIEAIEASQQYAGNKELKGYGDIYREAQAYEVLLRAMRHPEKRDRPDGTSYYPPIFVDSAQVRASFTEREAATLLNAYEITKVMFGAVEGLEDNDAETWIARLSDPLKGPFFLSQLDSAHWPPCIFMLAKTARGLCGELGLKLPSLEPSSESDPSNSADSTGSSGTPPTASSTDGDLVVTGDKLLTKEDAAELLRKRREEG